MPAASEHLHTAQWLINSDASGMLVRMKDGNGDTPAHDAAEGGYVAQLLKKAVFEVVALCPHYVHL